MGYEGLQKQTLEIRIGGTLDLHNDAFLVDAPSLLGSDNTRVAHDGALGKRNGSTGLVKTGMPTATQTPPVCVVDQLGTLAFHHAEGTYLYDSATPRWSKTNELAPRVSSVLVDSLIRTNNSLRFVDMAVAGGLACVVWRDDEEEVVQYAFIDTSTLAVVAGPKTHSHATMTTFPRVLAFDVNGGVARKFVLTGFGASGDIYASFYTVSVGSYAFGAPVLVGTPGAGLSVFYDICESKTHDHWTLCYPLNSNTIIKDINATGTTVSSQTAVNFYARSITYNSKKSSLVMPGSVGPSTVYSGKFAHMADTYASAPTVLSLHTPTGANTEAATIAVEQEDGRMVLFTDYDVVRISSAYAKTAEGTHNYTPIGRAFYLHPSTGVEECAVMCAGATADPDPLSVTVNDTVAAGIMFPVIDGSGALTLGHRGRALHETLWHYEESTGGVPSSRHLANPSFIGRAVWSPVPVATGLRSAQLQNVYKLQIDLVRGELINPRAPRSVSANGIVLTASGCGVTCFDSQQHAELTPTQPILLSIDNDATVPQGLVLWPVGYGAVPGAEQMRYGFMYVWTDGRGNKHRSTLMAYTMLQTSAVAGTAYFGDNVGASPPFFGVQFNLERPRFNALNGDRITTLEVEVYAGDPTDETALYLLGTAKPKSVDARTIAVTVGWGLSSLLPHVVNTNSDVGLQTSGAPLYYGVSGELEPYIAPAMLDIVSTQSRVWGLSAENRYQVWPSKPLVAGLAPEFSDELVTTVPAEGGPCVALAALDDKVIVFKDRKIFVLFGDPGDASGNNVSLQPARLISSDVGADSPLSVVEGPFGVVFNSERGIMLLDRGLALTPIGERVLDFTSGLVVTSGVLVPGETEVRWTLDANGYQFGSELAVTWNYKHSTWHTASDFSASCATLWDGDYFRFVAGGNGNPFVETPGTWTATEEENTVVTTPWVRLGGIEGYVRLWRILLIGRWWSGWLKVEIAYNYEDTWKESRQWTATELLTFGTRGSKLQVRIAPSEQKIESFRLRITERATVSQGEGASDPGRGFEWIALQLEAGTKRGAFKQLPAAAKK
jgi:hypothetical protein